MNHEVVAKNCEIYKKEKEEFLKVEFADKDKFSYFDEGQSLSNFKVQDQDSLGTCYANALTAAVKVSHKEHPDISYLHASMQTGTSDSIVRGDKKLYFESGKACDAFEKMKKKGGACPSKFSNLESEPIQESLLKSLGRYMDYYKGHTTAEREQLKQNLESLLSQSLELKEKLSKICQEDKDLGFVPRLEMDQILRTVYHTDFDSDCGEKIKEHIKLFYSKSATFNEDKVHGELSQETISNLRELFKSDEIIEMLDVKKKQKGQEKKSHEELVTPSQFLFQKIESFLKEGITPAECAKEDFLKNISNQKQKIFFGLYSSWSRNSSRVCDKIQRDELKAHLQSDKFQSFETKIMCEQSQDDLMLKDFVVSFEDFQKHFGLDFVDKISQSNLEESKDLFQSLVMPQCQKKENTISLEELECNTFSPTQQSEKSGCDKDKNCLSTTTNYELIQKTYQDKVFSHLKMGKGIIVNVCTGFMVDAKMQRSDFCRSASTGIEGHPYHSMSITGYRCVDGKIQYEILNSWGSNCPFIFEKDAKSDFFECQENESKNPTGKFWIDEDVLMYNTTHLDFID